jgi:hypothetical protein
MTLRPLSFLALVALFGCEEATTLEPLSPSSFDVVAQPTALTLSAAPSFADERGGGVFVDLTGGVVRVRPNGERGVLEPHPRNTIAPGPASGVFGLGPSNALVATDRGLFVADQGWLIAPSWQDVLPAEGLLGTTISADGVAWLVHTQGLYQLDHGVLTEFKVRDASLSGLTAMAAAPTLDGTPGIWFAHDGKLFSAGQTSKTEFTVRESGLGATTLSGGVVGMVGITPSRDTGGELWAITKSSLLLYTGVSWRQYTLPAAPRKLLGAGRFAWLQAGDAIYRYDADTRGWAEAKGLEAAGTLLSADAAGNAWVRVGEQTLSISPRVMPRVRGLAQNTKIYDAQLVIETSLPTTEMPDSLTWDLEGTVGTLETSKSTVGDGPTAGLRLFSLGGVEPSGLLKPITLSKLTDGWHELTVTATTGETATKRRVYFEFLGAANATVSWAQDIREIGLARCSGCHAVNTSPELITYAEWKMNAPAIAAAVRDSRMPADGPLDAAGVAAIVRWVNGGAQP